MMADRGDVSYQSDKGNWQAQVHSTHHFTNADMFSFYLGG
jgi:hypothetical protein